MKTPNKSYLINLIMSMYFSKNLCSKHIKLSIILIYFSFVTSLFSIFNASFNVADWGTNVEGFTILSIIAIPLTLIIMFFSCHDDF